MNLAKSFKLSSKRARQQLFILSYLKSIHQQIHLLRSFSHKFRLLFLLYHFHIVRHGFHPHLLGRRRLRWIITSQVRTNLEYFLMFLQILTEIIHVLRHLLLRHRPRWQLPRRHYTSPYCRCPWGSLALPVRITRKYAFAHDLFLYFGVHKATVPVRSREHLRGPETARNRRIITFYLFSDKHDVLIVNVLLHVGQLFQSGHRTVRHYGVLQLFRISHRVNTIKDLFSHETPLVQPAISNGIPVCFG